MERIDFKDLPDTTTPINATNLNKLQDNIEENLDMKTNIETIANENGTAIKFPDGTMICYGRKTFTFATLSSWGSIFTSQKGNMLFNPFPVSFIDVPVVNVSQSVSSGTTGDFWVMSDIASPVTKTFPGGYQVARASNSTNLTVIACYTAIGRWK